MVVSLTQYNTLQGLVVLQSGHEARVECYSKWHKEGMCCVWVIAGLPLGNRGGIRKMIHTIY